MQVAEREAFFSVLCLCVGWLCRVGIFWCGASGVLAGMWSGSTGPATRRISESTSAVVWFTVFGLASVSAMEDTADVANPNGLRSRGPSWSSGVGELWLGAGLG